MSKQIIHIWKGQEGTMCRLSHYPQEDGYVELSKMGTRASIQVNCQKCIDSYTKHKESKEQLPTSEFTKKVRILLATQDKTVVVQDAYALCDRLDASESSRKELLDACEFAVAPKAPFSTDRLEFANRIIKAIQDKAATAIAKAKKD